jgi:hypothetical protein
VGWAGDRPEILWKDLPATLAIDTAVPEVTWLTPGERQARAALDHFLEHRLPFYGERRNDPTLDGQSDLSPYLHFGHLAAARVALEVENRRGSDASREAFLEELIVRREQAAVHPGSWSALLQSHRHCCYRRSEASSLCHHPGDAQIRQPDGRFPGGVLVDNRQNDIADFVEAAALTALGKAWEAQWLNGSSS